MGVLNIQDAKTFHLSCLPEHRKSIRDHFLGCFPFQRACIMNTKRSKDRIMSAPNLQTSGNSLIPSNHPSSAFSKQERMIIHCVV